MCNFKGLKSLVLNYTTLKSLKIIINGLDTLLESTPILLTSAFETNSMCEDTNRSPTADDISVGERPPRKKRALTSDVHDYFMTSEDKMVRIVGSAFDASKHTA